MKSRRIFLSLIIVLVSVSVGAFWCYDSDGGNRPYTYGITTNMKGSYLDECMNESTLREFYCYYDLEWCYHNCLLGCLDGRCVQPYQTFSIHLHEGWNLVSVPLEII